MFLKEIDQIFMKKVLYLNNFLLTGMKHLKLMKKILITQPKFFSTRLTYC